MTRLLLKIFNVLYWLPVSVGNHTDYGGGGGGDFSNDFSNDTFDDDSFSGGGSLQLENVIIVIVTMAVIVGVSLLVTRRYNNSQAKSSGLGNINSFNKNNSDGIVKIIRAQDENFSSDNFLSWSKQVFCQLQEAWTERDWKKARPFESEELFNLHKSQLDEYVRNGTINVMENVCVNDAYLFDYKVENNTEFLTVFMRTQYRDYIIKEGTRKVIKGNPNTTYRVNYKAEFKRTLGVKTGSLSNKSTHTCPNCGAPVDVNAQGQCAYCGTVITDGTHDWVLCNLDDCGQTQF